jgi:hypothetical protein
MRCKNSAMPMCSSKVLMSNTGMPGSSEATSACIARTVASGSRHQNHVRAIVLQQRHVEKRRGCFGQPAILHVLRHADDFQPIARQFHSSSNRIAAWPESSCHRFVDDEDATAVLIVAIVDIATLHQRDAHGLKVVRPHGLIVEAHVFVSTGCVAIDRDIGERYAARRERQPARERDGLHAGHRCHAREEATIEFAAARLAVAAQERIERGEQDAMRIESRIGLVRFAQVAPEQPGADQRDHRERPGIA